MKNYDIILYGASSFVGQITAQYLDAFINQTDADNNNNDNNTQNNKVDFAVAGRNQTKLSTLTNQLINKDTTIIIADADDIDGLRAMVRQTKVIISTVGPYDLYGSKLVQVCAEEGVHYCDLAGEAHWIKQVIDSNEETARQTGACIVNCCGFDSVPSDLGVYLLQQASLERYGETCTKVDMRVKAAKGTVSGGTVASMVNIFSKVKKDPSLKKALANPYLTCPQTAQSQQQKQTRQTPIKKPLYEAHHKRWTAYFIMEAINCKVVHRSNALLDYQYSTDFTYQEGMFTGKGRKGQLAAYTITASLVGLALGSSFERSRVLLENYVLPKAGEGPSIKQQEEGFYNILFYGTTASGKQLTLQCTGDKDPGYGSTAKILGQAALCLLQDVSKDQTGGFWTPASLLNNKLAERLQAHSGVEFKII